MSPILGTLLASVGQSTEADQYNDLQWALMAVYNVPFFVASLLAYLLGNRFSKNLKEKAAKTSYAISVILSMIGILFMVSWGLGTF